MTAPDRDRSVLPKWARDELGRLERSVEFWRGKANEGPESSDTFLHTLYGEEARPLGMGPMIEFLLDDEHARYDVHLEAGELHITLHSTGPTQALLVEPWATNAIRIRGGRP